MKNPKNEIETGHHMEAPRSCRKKWASEYGMNSSSPLDGALLVTDEAVDQQELLLFAVDC